MIKGSIVYRIRRKMQYTATKILGYRIMTKIYYYIILKEKCNLKEPKSFNEKICWLKLNNYNENELVIQCSDKYLVRDYVKERIDEKYLIPLINIWNDVEEIDFSQLPNRFMLKCNHGCAYNILVNNKSELNINEVKKKLKKWMKEDFSLFNAEPQYSHIPRKIICEKHMGNQLVDYKFFCFNGHAKFFYVSKGLLLDGDAVAMKHYMCDGSPAPFQREQYEECDFTISNRKDEMLELAEKLAKPFEFVRVDFLLVDEKVYFSELTFTPGSGYNIFKPKEYLDKLGDELNLMKKYNHKSG